MSQGVSDLLLQYGCRNLLITTLTKLAAWNQTACLQRRLSLGSCSIGRRGVGEERGGLLSTHTLSPSPPHQPYKKQPCLCAAQASKDQDVAQVQPASPHDNFSNLRKQNSSQLPVALSASITADSAGSKQVGGKRAWQSAATKQDAEPTSDPGVPDTSSQALGGNLRVAGTDSELRGVKSGVPGADSGVPSASSGVPGASSGFPGANFRHGEQRSAQHSSHAQKSFAGHAGVFCPLVSCFVHKSMTVPQLCAYTC